METTVLRSKKIYKYCALTPTAAFALTPTAAFFTDAADTGIYTYDTAGRRLSKTYGGSTTEYLYCTTCRYAQVLEERDDLGNITAEYYIGNDLISKEDTTQELSYLYDGHGSVRKLINEYGGVPAQYSYDAYGILLESSGPSSEDNDFRYSGEQFDPELDQYYLRARYYNQNVGRFSNMDSWGGSLNRPLSLNKYNYTESNPVMGIDPSGRMTLFEAMVIVSVVGVMASCSEPGLSGMFCSPVDRRVDEYIPANDPVVAATFVLDSKEMIPTTKSDGGEQATWIYKKGSCYFRTIIDRGFLSHASVKVPPHIKKAYDKNEIELIGSLHTHPSKYSYKVGEFPMFEFFSSPDFAHAMRDVGYNISDDQLYRNDTLTYYNLSGKYDAKKHFVGTASGAIRMWDNGNISTVREGNTEGIDTYKFLLCANYGICY